FAARNSITRKYTPAGFCLEKLKRPALSFGALNDTKHAGTTASQQNTMSTCVKQSLPDSLDLRLNLKDHLFEIIMQGPLIRLAQKGLGTPTCKERVLIRGCQGGGF